MIEKFMFIGEVCSGWVELWDIQQDPWCIVAWAEGDDKPTARWCNSPQEVNAWLDMMGVEE